MVHGYKTNLSATLAVFPGRETGSSSTWRRTPRCPCGGGRGRWSSTSTAGDGRRTTRESTSASPGMTTALLSPAKSTFRFLVSNSSGAEKAASCPKETRDYLHRMRFCRRGVENIQCSNISVCFICDLCRDVSSHRTEMKAWGLWLYLTGKYSV